MMITILVFLVIGILTGWLLSAFCGWFFLWGLLLGFFGSQVFWCFFLWVYSLFLDTEKPITKQNEFGKRFAILPVSVMLNFYTGSIPTVTGEEKIPTDQRFLLVSNHRSFLDPFAVIVALKKHNICFISKPENLRIPMVGAIIHSAGFLAINRENDREALKTILCAADYMKKDLCSIGIYPEGTRSRDEGMLPFHAGSFKIAQRAKAPVVVMCTYGTKGFKVSNVITRKMRVKLDIIETIPAERVCSMSTQELADYAHQLIENRYTELEQAEKGTTR